MEAIKSLPVCPRLSDPDITKPDTLKGWLEWICLPEYFDVFQHNGFTSMNRIHILWEVELTSVSSFCNVIRTCHMWVEFVVGSLFFSDMFFFGYSAFPLSSKTKVSHFQFDQEC